MRRRGPARPTVLRYGLPAAMFQEASITLLGMKLMGRRAMPFNEALSATARLYLSAAQLLHAPSSDDIARNVPDGIQGFTILNNPKLEREAGAPRPVAGVGECVCPSHRTGLVYR